jgi:hypothetical protein
MSETWRQRPDRTQNAERRTHNLTLSMSSRVSRDILLRPSAGYRPRTNSSHVDRYPSGKATVVLSSPSFGDIMFLKTGLLSMISLLICKGSVPLREMWISPEGIRNTSTNSIAFAWRSLLPRLKKSKVTHDGIRERCARTLVYAYRSVCFLKLHPSAHACVSR